VEYEGIPFVKIPAGTYRQGTTGTDKQALQKAGLWQSGNSDEMPARTVQITRPFLVGVYEVRQKDWEAVMEAKNPSAFKEEPNRPVESVTWNQAREFCQALTKKSGGKATYRLPTEAEWEYVARAGGDSPFGTAPDKTAIALEAVADYATMNRNAENKTQNVGKRKPNAWGLYDTLGNVWEWCEDTYTPNAYGQSKTVDPVVRDKFATERVFRGGCYFLDNRAQRVALRAGNLPTFKSQYVGFRIVREIR
jgi:formylglycine-generating enzyme required for sulfatase activity